MALEYLSLSLCRLAHIPHEAFLNKPRLQELRLSDMDNLEASVAYPPV